MVPAPSDRCTITVSALERGATNVLFLDDKGEITSELEVAVDPPPPPKLGGSGGGGKLVKVYTKGVTLYRCSPDCEEVNAKGTLQPQRVEEGQQPPPPKVEERQASR